MTYNYQLCCSWRSIYLYYIFMESLISVSLTSSAKLIGAGLATIGVVGAGAGIGIVFAGY